MFCLPTIIFKAVRRLFNVLRCATYSCSSNSLVIDHKFGADNKAPENHFLFYI